MTDTFQPGDPLLKLAIRLLREADGKINYIRNKKFKRKLASFLKLIERTTNV